MAARASKAKKERDAAIEEAALAIFALQRVQKELEELKRRVATTKQRGHSCCCAENQNDQLNESYVEKVAELEVIQKRNDQILWHVGHVAEMIWEAVYILDTEEEEEHVRFITGTAAVQTLSNVKVAVLEQFQTLLPKDETHLYEEMHALYTEVAHREKLQERMADQIQTLLHENEDLEMRAQALEDQVKIAERQHQTDLSLRSDLASQRTREDAEKDAILEHQLDEIRDLQHQLDEKDCQLKQLLKMVEIQAAVISSEPGVSHEDQACNFQDEQLRTAGLSSENHCYDGYDEFEALMDGFQHQSLSLVKLGHIAVQCDASGDNDSQRTATTGKEEKTNLQNTCAKESAETVRILQAQLEMYVQHFQRKNTSKR